MCSSCRAGFQTAALTSVPDMPADSQHQTKRCWRASRTPHLALTGDQGVGVHAKALHVPVVQRDAKVILQEGELQGAKAGVSRLQSSARRYMKVHRQDFANQLQLDRACQETGKPGQGCRPHLAPSKEPGCSPCASTQARGRKSPQCASPPGCGSWGWASGRAPCLQTQRSTASEHAAQAEVQAQHWHFTCEAGAQCPHTAAGPTQQHHCKAR